jgi:hypothetical protein
MPSEITSTHIETSEEATEPHRPETTVNAPSLLDCMDEEQAVPSHLLTVTVPTLLLASDRQPVAEKIMLNLFLSNQTLLG